MDRADGKYTPGSYALWRDERDMQYYRLRIDKRDYKSIAKEWSYSGQGAPVKQVEGKWLECGKKKILLNIREKELQPF